MPLVKITEDTLWYGRRYHRGDTVVLEGSEYLDLLRAGRLETAGSSRLPRPAAAKPDEIRGCHEGELVFVFGNGPSLELARPYLTELSGFATIGMNRSYRLIHTTYLLFLDAAMWTMESRELLQCGSKIFCPRRLRLPYFTQFGRYNKRGSDDVLSEKWSDGLFWSRSSGVAAINLAYLFGAAEIAILGIDLRDNSHFYSRKGRGQPFLHAGEILEDLWWMSRKMLKAGRKLWNCSPCSAVRGFEKIGLRQLLRGGRGD